MIAYQLRNQAQPMKKQQVFHRVSILITGFCSLLMQCYEGTRPVDINYNLLFKGLSCCQSIMFFENQARNVVVHQIIYHGSL